MLIPVGRPAVKDILQGVAAKVDNEPCCDWVGEDGAGHYVKMVSPATSGKRLSYHYERFTMALNMAICNSVVKLML